eukprot:CAMPEP_0203685194 /NCGR_PEP_ID=MMETSP0090-20130426/48420_1 /ASSEMBLY_ACC=CAM_ASM_001088 /TAXON_ID=426623 /ORGANISM="Chaetoceros affinis, Strain CCMP159" /LENGTH=1325 /DNA_ID=CAMNT_0050554381 /DNA_START=512 /DNA_END=4489 /DNA_ORIENTATION=-
MRDLTRDALRMNKKKDPLVMIPHTHRYKSALLFIDMSGFTKLSLLLGIENLSRVINAYFQKIIDEVTNHGGDVLKFAGDAVFAEWRAPNYDHINLSAKQRRDEVYSCVQMAATCAANVVATCSDYPVLNDDGVKISTLNVHCGLAYGEMVGIHVGNDYNRREFIVLGESIDQVTKACDAAKYGELMASPEANDILQRQRHKLKRGMSQRYLHGKNKMNKAKDSGKPVIIACKGEAYFEKTTNKKSPESKEGVSIPFDKIDFASLEHLQKLLSLYVHPVVLSDQTGRRNSQRNAKAMQERHRSEAELRSVYTLFIKPIVNTELTKDAKQNKELYNLLDDILDVVTSVLDGYKGHLRQFIVDDKGVILIATFGLRGSLSPNMATERVLPASRNIHSALQNDLGINNFIGITLGQVYCGVVGGIKRHEYAVLGPSVNLSARLLGMTNHPGILVNDDVRQEAIKWGTFSPFPPMKAKGYDKLVHVYQPLSATEAQWGKVNPRFVGRRNEIKSVCKLAQEMAIQYGPTKMFFVSGESGAGKSDFLVQTVAIMRRLLVTLKRSVVVKGNIGKEEDTLVPFSLFRSILRDILTESEPHAEGKSPVPRRSLFLSIARHLQIKSTLALSENASIASNNEDDDQNFDHVSFSSISEGNSIKGISKKQLQEICSKLGASKSLTLALFRYMSGKTVTNSVVAVEEKDQILNEIVDLMAKIFIRCSSHADLTVVALDEIQYTDIMSWKVIQKIYEIGGNILFICVSRRSGPQLYTDDMFWRKLHETGRQSGRFQELILGPLEQTDIAKMASIVLSCKEEELDGQFVRDIFDGTGGMPDFAFQALENCKRKGLHDRLGNKKIGWGNDTTELMAKFPSLDELLLQRIDDLDDFTRNILHLASVLGHSFTLFEIIGVSEHVLSIDEDQKQSHAEKLRTSLYTAVKEGILDESVPGQDGTDELKHVSFIDFSNYDAEEDEEKIISRSSSEEAEDRIYTFCLDAWRQKILSYLLESYKRDIHEHATSVMKLKFPDIDKRDYRTKLKLFHHLKQCGNGSILEAAELAINIGQSLRQEGMISQSILVHNEALDMWRKKSKTDDKSDSNSTVVMSQEVIKSMDQSQLTSVIKLLTGVAQLSLKLERSAYSLEIINIILEKMMPRTNLRNIDNSLLLIYPILWMLRNLRMSKQASSVLDEFVFHPIRRNSGGVARLMSAFSSRLTPVHEPLRVLFDIMMYVEGETEVIDEGFLLWALESNSLRFTESIDETLSKYGRCASSVGAEICLLLVQNHWHLDKRKKKLLVEKGCELADKALKRARKIGYYETPYLETKPVYDQLQQEMKNV